MSNELRIAGMGVSKSVVSTIVSAAAEAVDAQIGVRVASIDVCIDELVFPKE